VAEDEALAGRPCGEERVSFLLARHGAVADVRLRAALAGIGYSPRQGSALLTLAARGRMSQQALCEALVVDPSVLVGILNDLEVGGLVERRRDPADRRRHIVMITAKGEDALDDLQSVLGGVERELFADLAAAELAQLKSLLARVRTRHDEPPCAG
jgi:DNA-binding MarR family transcriptional regulator